jgi:hypothetical protein
MIGSVTNGHARALGAWVRLEAAAVAFMVVAVGLCAFPLHRAPADLLQDALAVTANAFAAFVIGEVLGIAICAGLREGRLARVAFASGAVLGAASTVAALQVDSAGARAAWYALTGLAAVTVFARTVGSAVEARAVRRGPCLLATGATTCVAVAALELGARVAAAGPAEEIRALVLCGAAQGAVLVTAALFILYPPPPTTLAVG